MTNTKCQTGFAPYAGRCSRQTHRHPAPPSQTKPEPSQKFASPVPLLHDLVKLSDSGDPDVMFTEGVSQLDNAGGGGSESALSWSEVKSTCLGGAEDRAGTASGGPTTAPESSKPAPDVRSQRRSRPLNLDLSACPDNFVESRSNWQFNREFPKRSCLAASDVTGATLRIIRQI